MGHPWIFSGSVARIEGEGPDGDIADLVDAKGRFLRRGYLNSRSQIRFRVLTDREEPIDGEFFERRLRSALALRTDLVVGASDCIRMVNGEGDGIPGLIVDRYGSLLVCQISTAGIERLRDIVLDALERVMAPTGIWERSSSGARREEGIEPRDGLARGIEPPERIEVSEHGVRFAVDVRRGQKTGFYLDQRPARRLVGQIAAGRRVLDMFAHSGAFALAAAVAGAESVHAVDTSGEALATVKEHLALNSLGADAVTTEADDAFKWLRRDERRWGLMVLDPPAFAKRKREVHGACRGYKDVNRLAMTRLEPGGILITSSCSHHVDARLFQQVVFGAARDAGCDIQIVERLGAGRDHPVSIRHPEGEYLKTLVLRRST